MNHQRQGQMIPVSNTLRLKVGGGLGGLDLVALAKAEAAMKGLADNFDGWMQNELTKLDTVRERIRVDGYNADTAESLYFRAHDLKGLGATYGYPVVTSIADSLSRLLDDPGTRLRAPLFLLDAHISSIKAAVRSNIRNVDHPTAKTLLAELQTRVREYEA